MGGLRRGIAARAKEATQQVAQAGLDRIETLSSNFGTPPRADAAQRSEPPDESASSADVAEEVGRLRAMLDHRRPPPGPIRGRWSIGVGDLLAEHPRIPGAVRALARQLNRYGGLAISEQAIEFDHDAVEWRTVTEVRTRNLVDYLLSDAVNQQLDTVPLPWFPGRRKLLDALSQAILTLLLASAKQQLDRHADVRIPAEVEFRGAIRHRRQLVPGVLAALVLADPAVNECLQATAHAHGILVRAADDTVMQNADQRAEQLRAKLAALEARLGRTRAD
jgi:hypothetical protein